MFHGPPGAALYHAAMRTLVVFVDGLWQLLRLAVITRGRVRGRYWHWRQETAFGSDPSRMPGPAQRMAAVIRFGHWVGRMRRLGPR
jgi:hypothetical protein